MNGIKSGSDGSNGVSDSLGQGEFDSRSLLRAFARSILLRTREWRPEVDRGTGAWHGQKALVAEAEAVVAERIGIRVRKKRSSRRESAGKPFAIPKLRYRKKTKNTVKIWEPFF